VVYSRGLLLTQDLSLRPKYIQDGSEDFDRITTYIYEVSLGFLDRIVKISALEWDLSSIRLLLFQTGLTGFVVHTLKIHLPSREMFCKLTQTLMFIQTPENPSKSVGYLTYHRIHSFVEITKSRYNFRVNVLEGSGKS
jgi:hypothetical protein